MKFEDAMGLMLRDGLAVRRASWKRGRCMFVDVYIGDQLEQLVRVTKWDKKNNSLVSEDLFADDWKICQKSNG
jgi:hypothetical protein